MNSSIGVIKTFVLNSCVLLFQARASSSTPRTYAIQTDFRENVSRPVGYVHLSNSRFSMQGLLSFIIYIPRRWLSSYDVWLPYGIIIFAKILHGQSQSRPTLEHLKTFMPKIINRRNVHSKKITEHISRMSSLWESSGLNRLRCTSSIKFISISLFRIVHEPKRKLDFEPFQRHRRRLFHFYDGLRQSKRPPEGDSAIFMVFNRTMSSPSYFRPQKAKE